jgi:two-component system, NtrC family, sensor histidine kinase HydH
VSAKLLLDLLACVGHLGVAVLVLWRPAGNPLALIIGLLSLDLFAWNFASFAYVVSGRPEWHWLDLSLSPFSGALQLHAMLAFVGHVRRFRWALWGTYLAIGALSLVGVAAFGLPAARLWLDSRAWTMVLFGTVLPGTVLGVTLLLRHFLVSPHDERARSLVMLAAVLIGTGVGLTDFLDDFGLSAPSMSNVGTLMAMSLMAFIVLRLRFLDRSFSMAAAFASIAVAVLGIAAYVAIVLFADKQIAFVVVVTLTLAAALVAVGRRVVLGWRREHRQIQALATLGRLSAQMAHDLRNPLAAIKGGVQFLKEEVAQGRPLDTQVSLLELVSQQVDRLEQVVVGHQRLGRVEPQRRPADLNALVRDLLAAQPLANGQVAVTMQLDDNLPMWNADRDLLVCALENLVRNAAEAMPDGGTLTVRTAVAGRPSARSAVISVEDSGCGMDARAAERAFDEFFTTKETGSGLGLAFVRRIVLAHGGQVKLRSKPGRGTTVTLWLPAVASCAAKPDALRPSDRPPISEETDA